MGEYAVPLLFLVVVFVAFGLVHRNRYRSCAGCDDDCDKSSCDRV
ncbi:MAG: hypothetical protein P8X98_00335 [Woeseiaceae bacterium]